MNKLIITIIALVIVGLVGWQNRLNLIVWGLPEVQ